MPSASNLSAALRLVGAGAVALALTAVVCGPGGPAGPAVPGQRRQSLAILLAEAQRPVVLPPRTGGLTPDQVVLLRQVASRTWEFLSGPDLDPTTHLPRPSVPEHGPAAALPQPPRCAQDYTNPSLIGTYLTSIVAARDLGLASAGQAEADAAAVLGEIRRLPQNGGFLVNPCGTGGSAAAADQRAVTPAGYVSTVDNGWLAQGLLVARDAFPQLAPRFTALLNGMQWQLLYDRARDVLYNGYQVDGRHSPYTYDNAYSGPRIAEYMAIGSGKVPGALWWGPHRTPPADHNQRQVPQGRWVTYTDPQNHQPYRVFEGHYSYDGITFVPTFDGSLYQALAPDLVFPEQSLAPTSLGPNDRNTALAQAAYGLSTHAPAWGWAPATFPGPRPRYRNYGVPDLAIDQGTVAHAVVTPYAAFLALPVIPEQAYGDIAELIGNYPSLYTRYGFLDSVDIRNGQVATRYMASSQMTVLMSIDDAVDHGRLQTYVDGSSYQRALAPYMGMESYSITAADQN